MEKNNLVKKIEQYKEISESLLELIKSLSQYQPLPDWVPSELNNYIAPIEEAANETIKSASCAVQIGIMGEFNSGKTLLLGSLIGYADALPSSELPTTGNVTAIHLVQQPNFQTTQLGNFTVKYLSHKNVKECLNFMIQETEKLAKAAGLTIAEINNSISLSATTKVDTNGIIEWCQQIFNKTNSLGLRSLIRELVIFVRTYQVYGEHICDRSYSIDKAIAKQGLVLPQQSGNILEQEFENLFSIPKSWETYTQPSVRDLQNSFSLIHRIDVTVEISKEIWDLSSLQGTNEFVLLDFPGLGADDSSVRDTFVSLQELKEVQTILLLLDGRRPGAATATKIRTMLEQYRGEDLKDRIIVGIGRFNQLPLDNNHQEEITELSINETSISEETVLDKLPLLKRTISSANNLTTQKSNVILLSQLYGLNELADTSRLVQVCSPNFSLELDRLNRQDDSEIRQKWRKLSEILPTSSILQKQLSDFAEDGGIARLRSLLKDHVERHGIRLLLKDTKSKTQPITKAQQDLQIILPRIPEYQPVQESSDFLSLRQTIENLIETYNRFQQELETQPILKNSNGVAVTDIVKEELSDKIFFDWNQWKLLFERVNNGTISIESSNLIRRRTNSSIPTKSDDFYQEFERTIQEMQNFAQGKLREAVRELFSALSQRVELQNNKLRDMVQPEKENDIEQRFGFNEADLFKILLYAIDPTNQWQNELVEKSRLPNNLTPIKADDIFPLAHKDDKHQTSQIFHWSLEKKSASSRPFNHQIFVLRVRDEITASASLHLVEDVSKSNKRIKSFLSQYVKEILDGLRELLQLKYEPLLRYIASAEEPGTPTVPPWLELLSQIAKIRYPEIF